MHNQTDVTVGLKAVAAAAGQAAAALAKAAGIPDVKPKTDPQAIFDAKNTPTRAEQRDHARAFLRDGYREHKDSIRRQVANERGTAPDARELFRMHKARQAMHAQLIEEQRAAFRAQFAGNLVNTLGATVEDGDTVIQLPEPLAWNAEQYRIQELTREFREAVATLPEEAREAAMATLPAFLKSHAAGAPAATTATTEN